MELDTKPAITFDDIGGLKDEILEVREAVEFPLTHPESFERFGVIPPKGVLLYGPPGTGKTLIAKAVANNAGVPFLRMAGSELVHKYIGEGAQLVRDLFQLPTAALLCSSMRSTPSAACVPTTEPRAPQRCSGL